MSDVDNVRQWDDADVYVSFNLSAALPANAATPFGVDWTAVGFVDGGDGLPINRDQDVNKKYAFGGKQVKTSRKNKSVTVSFGALEANDTTRRLAWPGSIPGKLKWDKPEPVLVAFELREGDDVAERKISSGYAEVEVDGEMPNNDEDLAKTTFMSTIYPDDDGFYFTEQGQASIVSIAISPLTRAIGVGAFTHVTAVATFADATTQDITALATWLSSNLTKATVGANALITGIAAGTANISCTYGGVTSTAPCVVTVS